MNYYLRTLEGVPRLGTITIEDFKNKIFYRREYFKQDVETAVYYQLLEILETEGEGAYIGIKNYITSNYGPGEAARRGLERVEKEREEAAREAEETRRRQKEAAQEAAKKAAEAYKKAMDEQKAKAAAAVIEAEALETINEGATMNEQQIEIGTQLITPGNEFTVIAEDENTISYVDETGKLYIEEKAGDGWGWILAAAIGALFIL